jgi:hypothetical protein
MHTTDRLCRVSIPPFDPVTGLWPPGEHHAGWAEVRERFGWNLRRRRLLDGLHEGMEARGGFFPNVVEGASGKQFVSFFQTDRDGTSKGIVVIDPSKETWE